MCLHEREKEGADRPFQSKWKRFKAYFYIVTHLEITVLVGWVFNTNN